MSLDLDDALVGPLDLSRSQLRRSLAIGLFQEGHASLAKAAEIAGMDRLSFQHLLASRQIPVNYTPADLEDDLRTIAELGRL